jgi:hypothetical protein
MCTSASMYRTSVERMGPVHALFLTTCITVIKLSSERIVFTHGFYQLFLIHKKKSATYNYSSSLANYYIHVYNHITILHVNYTLKWFKILELH